MVHRKMNLAFNTNDQPIINCHMYQNNMLNAHHCVRLGVGAKMLDFDLKILDMESVKIGCDKAEQDHHAISIVYMFQVS